MYGAFKGFLQEKIDKIREEGLYKEERAINSRQGVKIKTADGREVLNFCANNYLGLAGDKRISDAAKVALDKWGYGMSSVRFICGTQTIHKELEGRMAKFLGTEDVILYSSAFDANGGVFEPLFDDQCAIISDELNHASIIDGVRLCKAKRYVYHNNDMEDLEKKLIEAKDAKFKVIATDGVFSMDGIIASLDKICALAEKYGALVLVDDSHATGFVGKTGRGTPEHNNVMGKVDIITTTFGKALGGSSGGCVAARKEIVEYLRQRSRPYLFSNTLSPAITATTIEVLNLLEKSDDLRENLRRNTWMFREGMLEAGFRIGPGSHPICPIHLGHLPEDAKVAQAFSARLYEEGIYVVGFFFPVVPRGKARIRVQLSAAHTPDDIKFALGKFAKVGKELGII